MEISKDTRLKDVLEEYPWLKEELLKRYEKFSVLDSGLGRLFLRKATIEDLSKRAGKTPEHLIGRLEGIIAEHEGAAGRL